MGDSPRFALDGKHPQGFVSICDGNLSFQRTILDKNRITWHFITVHCPKDYKNGVYFEGERTRLCDC